MQNIRESERVANTIFPVEIIALAKKLLMKPLTRYLKGFPLDLRRTTIRERSTWEDISRRDPNIPYFEGRSEFYVTKPGVSKGISKLEGTFKAPKNAVEFVIIIDSDQWSEIEQYEVRIQLIYCAIIFTCLQDNRFSSELEEIPRGLDSSSHKTSSQHELTVSRPY